MIANRPSSPSKQMISNPHRQSSVDVHSSGQLCLPFAKYSLFFLLISQRGIQRETGCSASSARRNAGSRPGCAARSGERVSLRDCLAALIPVLADMHLDADPPPE